MKKRSETGGKHIAPSAKKTREKRPAREVRGRETPIWEDDPLAGLPAKESISARVTRPVPAPEQPEEMRIPEKPAEEQVPETVPAAEELPAEPEKLPVPDDLSPEEDKAGKVDAPEAGEENPVPEQEEEPVASSSAEEQKAPAAPENEASEGEASASVEEDPATGEPAQETSAADRPEQTPAVKKNKSASSGEKKKTSAKKGKSGPEPSIPAIIVCAVLAAALLFLCLLVIKFDVLPIPLIIAGMAVLLGLAFICVALIWTTRKPLRFSIGIFMSLVMIAALVFGCFALQRTWKTAQRVTTVDKPMTVVGVYVKADDPAANTADLKDYTFGVIRAQDREDTDQALKLLASDLGSTIYVVEYDDVIRLIGALYNGEIQSAVFESYHIDLLNSMEGEAYAALAAQARQVGNYTVEKRSTEQSAYVGDIGESPIGKKKESGTAVTDDSGDHMFSIYVSGIDSYGTVSVQSRSDVNVMVFVNTKTHQVLMVNTPRDYYVYTTVSGQYRDKLTHAGLWGPECSMGTLEYLYDCSLDYYFRVNFSGFVDIVTALGGLDIALADDQPVLHFTPEEALLLARDRHYFGGEFARGLRHMRIIKALINQILSTDLLYNYSDLLDAVDESFITTVPYDLLAQLVKDQIRYNPSWDIITYAVTGTGTSDVCYSFLTYNDPNGITAYVSVPNYDTVQTAHDLIDAMSRDEIISEPEKNYKE